MNSSVAWKDDVLPRIAALKASPFGSVKASGALGGETFEIILLTSDKGSDRGIIDLLGRWRKENEAFFLSQFEVTYDRTQKWYFDHMIKVPDRLLFMIKAGGKYVGHAGLFRFDFGSRSCEIDNIVRGEKVFPGLMGAAIISMMRWGKEILGLEGYALKVLGDNDRAVRLYERLGYVETGRIPLVLENGKDGPEWHESAAGVPGAPARWYSVMTYKGKL